MKHKILITLLIIGLMFCGCKVGEIETKEFRFKKVFFNSRSSFTFEIGSKITQMETYLFKPATPTIHYDATDYNYCLYKWQKHWNWPNGKCFWVEIHLKSSDSILPGTENRGKFGLHPWGEIK